MEATRNPNFKYAVVLDFEATCGTEARPDPQEIIEFPSVLVNLETEAKVGEFSSFVQPVHHRRLTNFCTDLTSITQADVDAAPCFAQVLARHMSWLELHGVDAGNGVLVTCGDWDMQRMFPKQCGVAEPEVQALRPIYSRWLNVKTLFRAVVGQGKVPGMRGMLRALGLSLQGRHHRGIDDCRNIANILLSLVRRGGRIAASGSLPPEKFPPLRLRLRCGDKVAECTVRQRTVENLHRRAETAFKRRVLACCLPNGRELRETSDILWLEAGQEILVTTRDTGSD